MAPEVAVVLAQLEQTTHGGRFLTEDVVVATFPQVPAAEENKARVVSWGHRRWPGQLVEVLRCLSNRQTEAQCRPEGARERAAEDDVRGRLVLAVALITGGIIHHGFH
jgi:hypothetical protein